MKNLNSFVCTLLIAVAIPSAFAQVKNDPTYFGVFVGTSPCQSLIKPLLHIPTKAGCDLVKWELTLHKDPTTGTPKTYTIKSEYEFYISNSTTERKQLPLVEGKWIIQKNLAGHPGAIFYTLDSDKPETTLSLLQLDDNIIHVTQADKSLMIGDGGQSYSLNRKEPIATAFVKQTFPLSTIEDTRTKIVFHGRTPCQEIARVSAITVPEDCFKLKWKFTLNYDPGSHAPSTFSLERTGHRDSAITGTWKILHGTKTNPQALVYKLDTGKSEESLYLLQADRNVLFFMDKEMNLLVGNQEFDYTLNLDDSK